MKNVKRLKGRIVADTVQLWGETFWREKTIDAHFIELTEALEMIAGKNNLDGVKPELLASTACNRLYECELIARTALAGDTSDTGTGGGDG